MSETSKRFLYKIWILSSNHHSTKTAPTVEIERCMSFDLHYTFPSDEEGTLSFFKVVEDDEDAEFVPLEGEEEGVGSFLGSICSQ